MTQSNLRDITTIPLSHHASQLNWVGMEDAACPINLLCDPAAHPVPARLGIFVSLDSPTAKGIHMSRMYQLVQDNLANQCMTAERLQQFVEQLIEQQQDISYHARLDIHTDITINKPALISQRSGYQRYPVALSFEYATTMASTSLTLKVPYSSTCPCSAALVQQAQAEAFSRNFDKNTVDANAVYQWLNSAQGMVATPHSQRSVATVKLTFSGIILPEVSQLIKQLEDCLATPVQTAVKRADEQAFARLNAQNLMFCEDAARRLRIWLTTQTELTDYWFKVEHQESLHAHNAVVIDYKR